MDKRKILLIEDDFFIRDLYNRILGQVGFEMILAEDGIQGLELSKVKPDLILLDIMLPKMNGLEVLKRIKEAPDIAKIPVLLLTNLGQAEIIKRAFELGASGYLLKLDTSPAQLVAHANNFIANPTFRMDFGHIDLD